ncbi:peritrophin-48 [Teleopsis dalmanni]|uniref:peritrophin-48 n=1 Tax=Teleopsis dalmanni TaxID=139649 RepID=UPI0018CEA513|nr:peritrophin-48 [Teleopsis dalmanni]
MFAGVGIRIAFLLALAISSNAQVTVNMDHVCALVADNTLISTGSSCDSYYSCLGGVATLQSCPPTQYFSKDDQTCVPSSEMNCYSNGEDPCSGATVGTWVSVPGTCSDFYYCSATGALRSSCPYGENFDTASQSCVFASQLPCGITDNGDDSPGIVSINLCTYMQNGMYFGNPTSCTGWNKCTNNLMISGDCPTGFDYNVQIGECDYPIDTNCSQVTYDPVLAGAVSSGGPCTTLNAMKAASNCAGYYQCDGSNYQYYMCSSGLYYDTVSQTCVNRLLARNNCDRCYGTTESFVNMYSTTGCTGYLYCVKGVEQGTGFCTTGMYFNEVAGACVNQDPEFLCCDPGTTSTIATTATTSGITAPGPGSTTVANPGTGTTVASTTGASTTVGTTGASTTVASTTVASTTAASTTVASTTVASTTVASTTVA